MDDKSLWNINWTALFIVTACSTFIFSFAVKMLDGNFPAFLLIISAATCVMGMLSWLMKLVVAPFRKMKEGDLNHEVSGD